MMTYYFAEEVKAKAAREGLEDPPETVFQMAALYSRIHREKGQYTFDYCAFFIGCAVLGLVLATIGEKNLREALIGLLVVGGALLAGWLYWFLSTRASFQEERRSYEDLARQHPRIDDLIVRHFQAT